MDVGNCKMKRLSGKECKCSLPVEEGSPCHLLHCLACHVWAITVGR
jgi:hypothetical protein